VIVVQQKKTLDSYRQKYPNKKIKYIPHGNYIDVYGPILPRDYPLREFYGFETNDIVLLSFGAIKNYKFNEKIIDSVIEVRKINPKIKLLVIGKGDLDYVNSMKESTKNDPGIVVVNSFVSNDDIPKYLSLANYSIFYYDQSEMTSGGIILSLSYGVPVIARDIPGAEMITNKSGLIFTDADQLKDILLNLEYLGTSCNFKDDIIGSVVKDSWDHVSLSLSEIYKTI
jgi:glycosyltransferase involved in cell wall biosynthesis